MTQEIEVTPQKAGKKMAKGGAKKQKVVQATSTLAQSTTVTSAMAKGTILPPSAPSPLVATQTVAPTTTTTVLPGGTLATTPAIPPVVKVGWSGCTVT